MVGQIVNGLYAQKALGPYDDEGYTMTTNGPGDGTLMADHSGIGSDNESFYTHWESFGPKNNC